MEAIKLIVNTKIYQHENDSNEHEGTTRIFKLFVLHFAFDLYTIFFPFNCLFLHIPYTYVKTDMSKDYELVIIKLFLINFFLLL